MNEEENYLKNKKVKLNKDDLYEGEQKIFVLDDMQILDKFGNLIQEDTDILVNEDIQRKFKEDEKQFIQDSRYKYAGNVNFENKYAENKSILPHYDELKLDQKILTLDHSGNFNLSKDQQLEAIRRKLQGKTEKDSAQFESNVLANEYESKAVTKASFRKKGKKNNNKELLEFLDQQDTNQEGQMGQRQKFVLGSSDTTEQQEARMKSDNNYNKALSNANMQQNESRQRNKFVFQDDDLEAQLQKSLEQKVRYSQQQKTEIVPSIESMLAENNQEEIEKMQEEQNNEDQGEKQAIQPPKPKKKTQKTEKMEMIDEIRVEDDFLKNIYTDEQQQKDSKRRTVEFADSNPFQKADRGTQSVVQVSLPSERYIGLTKRQEELENQIPDLSKELDDETRDKLKQQLTFMNDLELNSGMSSTLAQLRQKGALTNDFYDYSGRICDIKPHKDRIKEEQVQSEDRVKLEYRDETGKLMTKKQAFRHACHLFHGHKPGHNKMEKKRKKELELEKIRQRQLQGNTVLAKALSLQQTTQKSAHLLLNTQKFGEQ